MYGIVQAPGDHGIAHDVQLITEIRQLVDQPQDIQILIVVIKIAGCKIMAKLVTGHKDTRLDKGDSRWMKL